MFRAAARSKRFHEGFESHQLVPRRTTGAATARLHGGSARWRQTELSGGGTTACRASWRPPTRHPTTRVQAT
eukprot:1025252-Prymnesium_polylepis.1